MYICIYIYYRCLQLCLLCIQYVFLYLSLSCASGKKHARQFDFMAMFEETRKTAIERSQPVLGNYFIFTCVSLEIINNYSCSSFWSV